MSPTRAERAAAVAAWADSVEAEDLRPADTATLRRLSELARERDDVDVEMAETVRAARAAGHTWSEIGAMLGVSKQAAQRKYGSKSLA